MKLRNKKTGEIKEVEPITIGGFRSLAELTEEWEDYEEPKVGYIVEPMGEDCVSADDSGYEESDVERAKELGIWFKTEEEAKEAVKKLKAWRRLKDKGFRFIGKTYETDKRFGSIFYKVDEDTYSEDIINDLDLLFGGEE